jgi:serine/threonine-protein kinase
LRRRSAILLVAALLLSRSAIAQPSASNAPAAETLFIEAEGLVEAGKFVLACPKFAESQRLDPQLGTLLHLADCYEKNGQTASAWATFREAAELAATKGDSRAQLAKDRAQTLASKQSTLAVVVPKESEIAGLEIERDGQSINAAMWGTAVAIDPGKYRIAAHAPNREPWTHEVTVTEPGKTVVTVPMLAPLRSPSAAAGLASPAGTERSAPRSEPGTGGDLRTAGWIIAGAGALGLAGAGVFMGVAGSKSSDADGICPSGTGCTREEINRYDQVYSEAQSAVTASRVLLGVGGALLVAGVVLVLVAPSSQKTDGALTARRPSADWKLSW